MTAEPRPEFEHKSGGPPRHIDSVTAQLDRDARAWADAKQTRVAMLQRGMPDIVVVAFAKAEQEIAKMLSRGLRSHVLWPWLSQYPGLGGAHVASVIGRIGDPRRFPGQLCSEGHYLPPLYAAGASCPVAESLLESHDACGGGAQEAGTDDKSARENRAVCPGVMLPPRTNRGVRSVWHYFGLHADAEGRAPRKRKGVQADWNPRGRASFMGPGGITEQIVRANVPYYVEKYRSAKERLILRVVDHDATSGDANPLRAAEFAREIEDGLGRPLRLFEADRIAHKVAGKAFLADLLTTWKQLG